MAVSFFYYQAPNSVGGHSGQFSLHLSHQGIRGLTLSMEPETSRVRRARWCHLSTMPGTTPHCLVNTEGNVNSLGLGTYSRDRRIMWCHLSTIPGTTAHYLVNTEGNVNSLGARNIV